MDDINVMLNQLTATLACPDLLALQQSVSDIAALEDELIECAARPLLLTLPRPAPPSADAPHP